MGLYGDDFPPYVLYLTIRWREPGNPMQFKLILPDGTEKSYGEDPVNNIETEDIYAEWYSGHVVSQRDTHMVALMFYMAGYNSLPAGDWILQLENTGASDQAMDLFGADHTGYLYVGRFAEFTTPLGTISHPATADSAISVGAYRANNDSWFGRVAQGDLSFYSGRGPRIDGVLGIDITGPSDGMAASYRLADPARPALTYASGTSGSLPQATGVAALLLQAEPSLDAASVKTRIQSGAILDGYTGDQSNPTWGLGKLSAYRTIYGEAPIANTSPVAAVLVPKTVKLEEPFVFDGTASTDVETSDQLSYRWDVGYTGYYEIAWSNEPVLAFDGAQNPGFYKIVLEVRDPGGMTDRTLAVVTVLDEMWQPQPDDPASGDVLADSNEGGKDTLDDMVQQPEIKTKRGSGGCSSSGKPLPFGPVLVLGVFFSIMCWLRREKTA
jgi:subtilisin family serine protease